MSVCMSHKHTHIHSNTHTLTHTLTRKHTHTNRRLEFHSFQNLSLLHKLASSITVKSPDFIYFDMFLNFKGFTLSTDYLRLRVCVSVCVCVCVCVYVCVSVCAVFLHCRSQDSPEVHPTLLN